MTSAVNVFMLPASCPNDAIDKHKVLMSTSPSFLCLCLSATFKQTKRLGVWQAYIQRQECCSISCLFAFLPCILYPFISCEHGHGVLTLPSRKCFAKIQLCSLSQTNFKWRELLMSCTLQVLFVAVLKVPLWVH